MHFLFGSHSKDLDKYLIFGLGNPGREYRDSRHNIGFMAVERFALDHGWKMTRVQNQAIVGTGEIQEKKVILAKPQTFMNLSGRSALSLLRFYKIPYDHFIVIHDDLDLPLGTLRIRASGSSGGQKGLGSVIELLGTQDFPRLRLGIGRPPGRMDAADYVLEKFLQSEKEILNSVLDQTVSAINIFITNGLEIAMNQFNGPVIRE